MKNFFKLRNLKKIHFLDKQQRFVIQTVLLTAGLLIAQLIWQDFRFLMVLILAFASYILTAWSLKEDIVGAEWILLFILPVAFTVSVSLFYFLLPGRWISRLVVLMLFAVGTYAIIRAENIYNVAAERSIGLLRVAQTVGLLITLTVVFFFTIVIFSLRTPFWINFFLMTIINFILALQSLWTIRLDTRLTRQLFLYSGTVSLVTGEIITALSFWPVFKSSGLAISALFISSVYYCLVGTIQQHLQDRLFANVIREYIFTFIFMLILLVLSIRWG